MNQNWAEENLQTIRTLMERSALYRRALAPIMVYVGVVGAIGGVAGWRLQIESGWAFVSFWSGAAVVALVGTLILVRRQALKDSEPFWSPPTRRVTQALAPPFTIGAFLAALVARNGDVGSNLLDASANLLLIPVWCFAFGCAIHSAGFFVPRGIKYLGWLFILAGCLLLVCIVARPAFINLSPHLLMGGLFGGLHLLYGIYLYFTEKKTSAA